MTWCVLGPYPLSLLVSRNTPYPQCWHAVPAQEDLPDWGLRVPAQLLPGLVVHLTSLGCSGWRQCMPGSPGHTLATSRWACARAASADATTAMQSPFTAASCWEAALRTCRALQVSSEVRQARQAWLSTDG